MHISESVAIDAPLDAVWAALSDLASHVDWMADAAEITFETDQRSGIGTAFECLTKVGPLSTRDHMLVTDWVERERVGVTHKGLVTGTGVFEITAVGPLTTRMAWTENLKFPRYFAGPVGEFAAKPILRRVWRGNLSRFKALLEAQNHLDRY